jgi:uncharacterized protein (TIGR00369 family)
VTVAPEEADPLHPPQVRVLNRYLRLEHHPVVGEPPGVVGRVSIDDHLRGPHGGVRTGALLAMIDSVGGLASGMAVLPDWVVSTNLMLRLGRLEHRGPLRLEPQLLRRGRSMTVSLVTVRDEGAIADPIVASALIACTVLNRAGGPADPDRPQPIVADPFPEEPPALEDFFAVEPGAGSITRMELAEHLRNPWGILHGGALAVLADAAAVRAAEDGHGPRAAGDTVLHFLNPVRTGPAEARCEMIGSGLVRVSIHDTGEGDRPVALATVTADPAPARAAGR